MKVNKKHALNLFMDNGLSGNEYIPFDKSWMIRIGVLDLLNGYENMINLLRNQKELGEDLQALLRSSIAWKENKPIDVGESATLYRCLRYASWTRGEDRKFIKQGTLLKREICDNPDIINWPLEKLLTLDGGTTQWVTAARLCGRQYEPLDMGSIGFGRVKLDLTESAIWEWEHKREDKMCWDIRYDITLRMQVENYLNMLAGIHDAFTEFIPQQAEDYCFARAFGYMSPEEGAKRWPQLRNHESDRINAMEAALIAARNRETIVSDDHRVVQAMAMWGKVNHVEVKFSNPNAVKKSWPQFWKFLYETSTEA